MFHKYNNLVLDFTHIYDDEHIRKSDKFHWLDLGTLTGCDMYCSHASEMQLGKMIDEYGINGIHFIDSGNYHYITKIMTDRIKEPFVLVLFDHHTDMQKPMIDNMVSCGDWAGSVLDNNRFLKQAVLIGPQNDDIEHIDVKCPEKLITFSAEELRKINSDEDINNIVIGKNIQKICTDVPVYISIDKDILDKRYVDTNWSQGHMSVRLLETLLKDFIVDKDIIGIDICGECRTNIPFFEYLKEVEKDGILNQKLYEFMTHYLSDM